MSRPTVGHRFASEHVCELWLVVALCALLLPSSASAAPCTPVDGIESICSLVAPEDIVRSSSAQHLVFGQLAAPGGLYLLDTRDDAVLSLTSPESLEIDAEAGWGDPACSAPPQQWLLHGLDSAARPDGRWQVLAVNHGGREAVEFFELKPVEEGGLRAIWRGCVEAPQEGNFNDVASLSDGGFVVSQPTVAGAGIGTALLALLGVDSGAVYRWRPGRGFSEQPGTRGRFPNGVVVSADERILYMNEYIAGRVRLVDMTTGASLGVLEIDKPDNSNWSQDGKLLVASHKASIFEVGDSREQSNDEPSLLPFSIVEVDPDTLETRELVFREGLPMGAGTAAVDAGSALYIGSYVGDRIIKIPLSR